MRPPFVVLEPDADLTGPATGATRRGFRVHTGFDPPAEPWDLAPRRTVVVGTVTDASDAEAALLCAVRGAGVIVRVDRGRPWAPAFLADLGRLGAGPGRPAAADPAAGSSDGAGPALSAEQRDLLELLAEGNSIAQAAKLRFLSLRTANRRVAEARTVLGVSTTREAVLAFVKLRGDAS